MRFRELRFRWILENRELFEYLVVQCTTLSMIMWKLSRIQSRLLSRILSTILSRILSRILSGILGYCLGYCLEHCLGYYLGYCLDNCLGYYLGYCLGYCVDWLDCLGLSELLSKQKSLVEYNDKCWFDLYFQNEYKLWKRGLAILSFVGYWRKIVYEHFFADDTFIRWRASHRQCIESGMFSLSHSIMI